MSKERSDIMKWHWNDDQLHRFFKKKYIYIGKYRCGLNDRLAGLQGAAFLYLILFWVKKRAIVRWLWFLFSYQRARQTPRDRLFSIRKLGRNHAAIATHKKQKRPIVFHGRRPAASRNWKKQERTFQRDSLFLTLLAKLESLETRFCNDRWNSNWRPVSLAKCCKLYLANCPLSLWQRDSFFLLQMILSFFFFCFLFSRWRHVEEKSIFYPICWPSFFPRRFTFSSQDARFMWGCVCVGCVFFFLFCFPSSTAEVYRRICVF